MVAGAIELAVHNCRSLAGSRIGSRATGNSEAREIIRDVPKPLVASTLGEARTRTLCPGVPARKLVSGGSAALAATLLGWNIEHAEAARICRAVEQHAALTLFQASPGAPRGELAA